MDTSILKQVKNKFDIHHNKTYNPPNLKIEDTNLLIALAIGFIDGDGCIDNQTNRNDVKLRVKCHSTWLNTLKYIFNVEVKINNQGYCYFNITNSILLKEYKNAAINMDLPCLDRKWNKINLDFISKQQQGKINKNNVLKLKLEGKRNGEICKILNMKPSSVSQIFKRNNL